MKTVKRSVSEVKVCFDPQLIEEILSKIDHDPSIAPKGISQIAFYNELVNTLQYRGEMMEVTVSREVPVDEQVSSGANRTVPANGGTTVWSAEDDDTEEMPVANPPDQIGASCLPTGD